MKTDIAEVLNREHKVEIPEPRMILADALADGCLEKYQPGRERKRAVMKIMKDFEAACTRLTQDFFSFVKKEKDIEIQKERMITLDTQWKQWLNSRRNHFNYANCKDFFSTKLDYMIKEKIKSLENLPYKVAPNNTENK